MRYIPNKDSPDTKPTAFFRNSDGSVAELITINRNRKTLLTTDDESEDCDINDGYEEKWEDEIDGEMNGDRGKEDQMDGENGDDDEMFEEHLDQESDEERAGAASTIAVTPSSSLEPTSKRSKKLIIILNASPEKEAALVRLSKFPAAVLHSAANHIQMVLDGNSS